MLSMPPAITTSTLPASNESWASIVASMPEPHILLRVVQRVALSSPAPRAAWRAGAWPRPAGNTQPNSTSSTASLAIPARSTAARIAAEPSCGAVRPLRSPWNAPMGVRAALTITMGSVMTLPLLLDCHAQGTVETDHLAIEHAVFNDVPDQRGIFARFAQARRERHPGGQGVADFRGHARHHRGFENTGGDGHHPNAEARQLPRGWQCQAGDRTFGRGIRRLTDLPVKRRHRRGIDDHAALTVGIRLGFCNGRSGQAQQVEAADQVDVDHLGKAGQPMGAVLAEDLLAAHHTGAVHQPVQATKGRNGGLHGGFASGFLADVRHGAAGVVTQLFGFGRDRVGIQVHQHHLGTGSDQHFSGGCTEARRAAADQKNLVFNLHYCFLEKWIRPTRLAPWRFPDYAK